MNFVRLSNLRAQRANCFEQLCQLRAQRATKSINTTKHARAARGKKMLCTINNTSEGARELEIFGQIALWLQVFRPFAAVGPRFL